LPEAQKHQPDIVRVDLGDDHGLTIGRCGEARLPLVTGHPKRSNRTTPAAIGIDYEQLWNRALRLAAGVEKLASSEVPCIESDEGIREGPNGLLFFSGEI